MAFIHHQTVDYVFKVTTTTAKEAEDGKNNRELNIREIKRFMLLLWPDASVLILRYTQTRPSLLYISRLTVVLSMSQEIQNFTDYKANNRQTQKVVFSRFSAMLAFEYLAPFSSVLILCCTRMDWKGRTATEGSSTCIKYITPYLSVSCAQFSVHSTLCGLANTTTTATNDDDDADDDKYDVLMMMAKFCRWMVVVAVVLWFI